MTINEIAKLAGVSRATVSRYLNDGYVSDEKRERIKKVIKETGYVPSAQAQTMRTKKTRVIGVIIPRLNSDSIGGMCIWYYGNIRLAYNNRLFCKIHYSYGCFICFRICRILDNL